MGLKQDVARFLSHLISSGTKESSMRFIAVFSTILISLVWAGVCLCRLQVVDMPWGVVTYFGIAVSGKVGQNYFEKEKSK